MSIDREESLFLTVSEDHRQRPIPEYVKKMSDPVRQLGGMAAAYEGVILGGADKLFGLDELNVWLRRHRYADYNMEVLLPIAHMCLEYAVRLHIRAERPGIQTMARQAARQLLEGDPLRLRATARNWMYICWMVRQFPQAADHDSQLILQNLKGFEDVVERFVSMTEESAQCQTAQALVERAVLLYKKIFTRYFAPDHDQDPVPENMGRPDPLAQPLDEGEPPEPDLQQADLSYEMAGGVLTDGVELPENALAAIPESLEKNFGPSYQTAQALEEMERTVCVDIHENRKLLFTDGLPESAYEGTSARAENLRASRAGNRKMVEAHESSVRQGVRSIEQAFHNALNLKNEPETYRASWGALVSRELWKAGRCRDPKLFEKVFRQDDSTVVVELLIDASGSQSVRQAMVAMQSYLFSAALSAIHIPHRVMSYCTYGDHTVLRRFRDYDDGPAADRKILEYRATSNNRDGLALAAAGVDLMRRREDHKILIVFSDGLPNDMVSGRVRAGKPKKYVGEEAVRDTCFQVRKLRRAGAYVLGIFLGDDDELENERMIYGSAFLRIRRAEDFGGSAGKRLSEILLQL